MTGLPVTIVGWGRAVPDGRVTNADLEARVDTTDAWIVERSGIRERRIAGPGESTATLATTAAANAIKRAGLAPDDIDLLIVATASPEQPLPHTGAFVGEALGCVAARSTSRPHARASSTSSSSAHRCSASDTNTC